MRRGRCLQLTCAAFARAGWVGSAALSRAAAEGPGGKEAPAAIQLFQFKPSPVEVKAGTRVTSGTPENRDGRFDGKLSGKGTTFAFDFTQPGTYSYFCARHQSMRGEIVVN